MSQAFDPYHRWLGIAPKDQPPDYYRLLSVDRFEGDLDVITEAADRQMRHVRTHQAGKYAQLSQKVLNEIATARVCLLHPEKKAAYDRQLRAQLAAARQPRTAIPLPSPAVEPVVTPAAGAVVVDAGEPSIAARRTLHRQQRPAWLVPAILAGAGAAVMLFVGILVVVLRSVDSDVAAQGQGKKTHLVRGDKDAETRPPAETPPRIPAEPPPDEPSQPINSPPPDPPPDPPPEPPPGTTEKATPPPPEKLADLVSRMEPSVVRIDVRSRTSRSVGSGFIVKTNGLVMTNYHVIRHALVAEVVFHDGTKARVTGYVAIAPEKDLAVLKLGPTKHPLTPVPLAKALPRKGEDVVAIGAPHGLSQTVTAGIVSAIRPGSEIQDSFREAFGAEGIAAMGYDPRATWIQFSAPISPGNSGGPLVNMQGEVVGVNTWQSTRGQNLNFAASSLAAAELLSRAIGPTKLLVTLNRSKRPGVGDTIPGRSVSPGASRFGVRGDPARGEVYRFTRHNGAILDLSISSDGRYLATASADKIAGLLNLKTLKKFDRLEGVGAPIECLTFSPDGRKLFTGSSTAPNDRDIQFWDFDASITKGYVSRRGGVLSIVASPDGLAIATTHASGVVDLRRTATLQDAFALTGRDRQIPIHRAEFSTDGNFLAIGGGDGTMYVWSTTGQPRGAGDMRVQPGPIRGIAFSLDGIQVATAGGDNLIRVWTNWRSKGKWRQARRLEGHQGEVLALAASRDGTLLASGSVDKTVRVWDAATGKPRVFTGHSAAVTAVAFFPSGRYLASGSRDGTVRFWNLHGNGGDDELATALPTIPHAPQARRANDPVPTGDALQTATALVKEIFKEDFANANDPPNKLALVRKLLAEGGKETNTPADRFALLKEARQLAIDLGSPASAVEVTEAIIAWFDVIPDRLMLDTVERLTSSTRTKDDRAALAETALVLADDAAAGGRYDAAARLAEHALSAARAARDARLIKRVRLRADEIETHKKLAEVYARAGERLKENPDDAQANFEVGHYLCVVAGDWERGLPHLAKGSHAPLRSVAERELAKPTDAAQQADVGQAWRQLAEPAAGDEKTAYLRRARTWYQLALPNLAGLQKLKIERELKELAALINDEG